MTMYLNTEEKKNLTYLHMLYYTVTKDGHAINSSSKFYAIVASIQSTGISMLKNNN